VPQGAWGYRHQFNIADSGMGREAQECGTIGRGSGRTLNVKDFDLERIFGRGVQIVHLSGLIGALSPETGHFVWNWRGRPRSMGPRFRLI